MVAYYSLAGITFFAVFIMFLVVSRTCNSIINLFIKLEYLVQKEYDLKKELIEVRRLMEEQAALAAKSDREDPLSKKKRSAN